MAVLLLLSVTGVGTLVGRMMANTSSGVWAKDPANRAAIIVKAESYSSRIFINVWT
jgi:hypothetical protein